MAVKNDIKHRKIGFLCRSLDDGSEISFQKDTQVNSASLIKLYIMLAAFVKDSENKLSLNKPFILRDSDKLPSCGALNLMHDGLRVSARDLINLMIALSDNTATNMLIDELGIDYINGVIKKLGCRATALRRRLFDAEASAQGLRNTTSAADCALLLEGLYKNTILDPRRCGEMLEILKKQKLNSKIPFYLRGVAVAHKTGEDDGITHDVGIVYAKRPFIVCFCSDGVDTPSFERTIADISRDMYSIYNAESYPDGEAVFEYKQYFMEDQII